MRKFLTVLGIIGLICAAISTLAFGVYFIKGEFEHSTETEEIKMITFYIGQSERIECTCPEGYTLQEYFDSEYLNEEVTANDYGIFDGQLGYQGTGNVPASTVITAGATYP